MYTLHIANKNYSSWSLRPWVLMSELDIPFQEVMHPFGALQDWDDYRKLNPSGLVPCLTENNAPIWDSLAIIEYLGERHEGVWPSDPEARSWARSASAEMHSGFAELRNSCPMTCGLRVKLHTTTPALARDIDRIDAIWQEGLEKFEGPFLAGSRFTAVDAFYAPVAFRFQTYGVSPGPESAAYLDRILQVDSMVLWYNQALDEPYRDEAHEVEMATLGEVTADLRRA